MAQQTGWIELPTEFDPDHTVAPMATASARTGVLLIRKIEDAVETWPGLDCTKTIDLDSKDMAMIIELEGDTFHATNSADEANWDFDPKDSNLEIYSIARLNDLEVCCTFKEQETWPFLTVSGVSVGDENPPITVECEVASTFHTTNSTTAGNWTLTPGDSGLTFGAITWNSANKVTIATTGTAVAGKTFTIQAKVAAFASGAYDSGIATYDIDSKASTCTQAPVLQATSISLRATKAALVTGTFTTRECTVELEDGSTSDSGREPDMFFGDKIEADDEDPVMKITLNEDEWASVKDCQNLKNWKLKENTSGLSIEYVNYESPREATIGFSGTALAGGSFSISLSQNATFYGIPMVATYEIDGAAWTNDGNWASQPLAGSIDAYLIQDVPFLVGSYALPTGTDLTCAIRLDRDGMGWDPRFWQTFVYNANVAESNAAAYFMNLVMDT